jgi:hypothetical protein
MPLRRRKEEAAIKRLFVPAVILVLSSGQFLLAADKVPEFKPNCRDAEESGTASRNAQACFQDEQTAKDTLKQNWTTYDSDQKNHCQRLLKAGGMPSYVELLTCVEMKTAPTSPATTTKEKRI